MEGCPAGDAGPVLNTGGGRNAQGFDYAILPPSLWIVVFMVTSWFAKPVYCESGNSSILLLSTNFLCGVFVEYV